MNVCHTLIFCFFISTLQDGNTCYVRIEDNVVTAKEGGNMRRACDLPHSGKRRIFCREECGEKDILIDTTEDRAQRGRYSVEVEPGSDQFSSNVLYVSITNLTKSDSGVYRCRSDRNLPRISTEDFMLQVEDAPVTSKPKQTPRPFFAAVQSGSSSPPSASTPPTPQSLISSSGNSSSSSASTLTTNSAAGSGVVLYVRLTLVIVIIVSSAAVLIFCRRKINKPAEARVDAEYVNVTEVIHMSKIREEDRRSRSPAKISIV